MACFSAAAVDHGAACRLSLVRSLWSYVLRPAAAACGLIVVVGLSACGTQVKRPSSAARASRPVSTANRSTLPTTTTTASARPHTGRTTQTATAARRFAAATVAFDQARKRVSKTISRQLRQTRLTMQTGCAQILSGAGGERAFGVGVVTTLIQQSAGLKGPYLDFSRALLGVHAAEPALARAARDTASVAMHMQHLSRLDADPCEIARGWQAGGWRRDYFRQQLDSAPGAPAPGTVAADAYAAMQRLGAAGVSYATAQSFQQDLDPITLS